MSWYLMHRGWMDNPVFDNEAYTQREAWEWLISNAVHQKKGRTVSVKNMPRVIPIGSLCYSLRFLANAWGWDKARVSRFLKRLEKWDMIETATETGQTLIAICNYKEYQRKDEESETVNERDPRQERDSGETNKKEGTKKDKEYKDYTVEFSEFWSAYPKRDGSNPRKPARLKFIAACKIHAPEDIILGAKKYAAQEKRKGNAGTPYIAQAQTWLNQERWKDEYDTGKTKRQNYIGM